MINRRVCVLAIVLVLAATALGVRGVGLFGAVDKETRAGVAKQEKALAEQALKFVTRLEEEGQVSPGLRDVPRWSRRLVEATRKSGADQAEMLEAIKQHVARMSENVDRLNRLYKAGAATKTDILDAEYHVLEAKALLVDEQDR